MTTPVRPVTERDRGVKTPARPRGRGRAPAPTGARPEASRSTKSTAAQRAYARRSQRTAVGSAPAPTGRGAFRARIPFVATIIGLLSVGLAITLLLTTRAAEDSYRLSAAKAHNQELVEKKAAMERDSRVANSAPELARKAGALGMIPAKDVARLVVAEDGTVTVVGKPTPAAGAPLPVPPAPATGLRGGGTAATALPAVGSRNPAPPASNEGSAPSVAAAPPAPAATGIPAAAPQAADQPHPAMTDGQLVPTPQPEQAGSQGGPR